MFKVTPESFSQENISQSKGNGTGLIFLWLSLLVIGLDLFTKYLVVNNFSLKESLAMGNFFNLTYARNYGAAFSFLSNHSGWQKNLFIGIAIVISLVLIKQLYSNKQLKTMQNTAYALIIGGALGNAIDRFYNGYVIDFLDFYYQDWHYPTFNIADIAICVGALLLILDSLVLTKSKEHIVTVYTRKKR